MLPYDETHRVGFACIRHYKSAMTRHTQIENRPIWSPDPAHVSTTRIYQFSQFVGQSGGGRLDAYEALWRWSVEQREKFWSAVWSFCGVRGSPGNTVLADGDRLPGARWFPEARMNFAHNLLGRAANPQTPAVVFWGEDKIRRHLKNPSSIQISYC